MNTTYAIIQSGNKQFRVKAGDLIDVDLLQADKKATIDFDDVLLFHNGKESLIDKKLLTKAIVRGEILDHVRGPKVIAYKYKKRKKCRSKVGHRQHYSRVKITELSL